MCDAPQLRFRWPLDGDCFIGMDVPIGPWGPEEIAFWTATEHYTPWRDVASFFKGTVPTPRP